MSINNQDSRSSLEFIRHAMLSVTCIKFYINLESHRLQCYPINGSSHKNNIQRIKVYFNQYKLKGIEARAHITYSSAPLKVKYLSRC